MSESPKTDKDENDENADTPKVSPMNVVASTLAAGFGVQSEKNRERDFAGGNMKAFVISGIIFTLLLVIGMAAFVNLVVLP